MFVEGEDTLSWCSDGTSTDDAISEYVLDMLLLLPEPAFEGPKAAEDACGRWLFETTGFAHVRWALIALWGVHEC
jgi:hypothetical protein